MNVKQYLRLTGMSHEQFAKKLNMTPQAVTTYVAGTRTPRIENAARLIEMSDGFIDLEGLYPKLHELQKKCREKLTEEQRNLLALHKTMQSVA